MGLAEAKSRRKISKDPNNTKWTRDTNSFGQKIMRSQGWEPGQYLGAKDAPHAVHHTAANASFIRVALKDDMLGLGFKRAKDDEVTGMGFFQDLLGRLNGKSDEVLDKERAARAAFKTNMYCETKFGPMRFVKGGLLVGDKVKALGMEEEDDVSKESGSDSAGSSATDVPDKEAKEERKSRKRKVVEDPEPVTSGDDSRAFKKSKKQKAEDDSKTESGLKADRKAEKKRRKEAKKAAKLARKGRVESTPSTTNSDAQEESSGVDEKEKRKSKFRPDEGSTTAAQGSEPDSAAASKKEKRKKEKKEKVTRSDNGTPEEDDKTSKKEKKRRRRENKPEEDEVTGTKSGTEPVSGSLSTTPAGTGQSTPTGTGTSTPVAGLRGHHLVRSRWIAQKRAATLDAAALNQIFMIKQQS